LKLRNSIDARLEFSFKGEIHGVSATLDLDSMMIRSGAIQDIHGLLAMESKTDIYSYQYEVMEMQEVIFDNAGGLAVECLSDGDFDVHKFEQLWTEANLTTVLAPIALTCLNIDDLDQHPDLRAALIAAYNLAAQK
jgi:hypothetical protein